MDDSYCSNCGQLMQADANFCTRCGKPKSGSLREERSPSEKEVRATAETHVLRAEGITGQIELSNGVIVIARKGLRATLSQGKKGEKTILVDLVTRVDYKKPSLLANGHIHFLLEGEKDHGILNCPLTVIFRKQEGEFGNIAELVNKLKDETPKQKPPRKRDLLECDLEQDVFVAIDLETTGFSPQTDKIIEIGMVRFRGGQVLDEFATLVDPQRTIPPIVRRITGISSDMVKGKPTFEEVEGKLREFIGQSPVVGFNIPFDLGFLRNAGVDLPNTKYDVMDMGRGKNTLQSLARDLGVPSSGSHRALDDAKTTMMLFWKLRGEDEI